MKIQFLPHEKEYFLNLSYLKRMARNFSCFSGSFSKLKYVATVQLLIYDFDQNWKYPIQSRIYLKNSVILYWAD
ncbi:hypothetical protein D7Z94_22200 [Ulvibacterium marinum]|uniref:Uncharacterized protein n=1 Tax=Ulvibacterium marinum TaxID=2419782 RepID=A0A3B0C3W9_9FLAO|nr:hypothetical protein D7Z94_22200 [Ulvibacterium marinum]